MFIPTLLKRISAKSYACLVFAYEEKELTYLDEKQTRNVWKRLFWPEARIFPRNRRNDFLVPARAKYFANSKEGAKCTIRRMLDFLLSPGY